MMKTALGALALSVIPVLVPVHLWAQRTDETGFHPVSVTHSGNFWMIAGQKNTVSLNETTLAVAVKTGATTWNLVPSSADDVLIGIPGDDFHLKLASAGRINIAPYRTGYKTGVKLIVDE